MGIGNGQSSNTHSIVFIIYFWCLYNKTGDTLEKKEKKRKKHERELVTHGKKRRVDPPK